MNDEFQITTPSVSIRAVAEMNQFSVKFHKVTFFLYRYSNIFVTAPSPENLKTVFEYICKGLECLSYRVSISV